MRGTNVRWLRGFRMNAWWHVRCILLCTPDIQCPKFVWQKEILFCQHVFAHHRPVHAGDGIKFDRAHFSFLHGLWRKGRLESATNVLGMCVCPKHTFVQKQKEVCLKERWKYVKRQSDKLRIRVIPAVMVQSLEWAEQFIPGGRLVPTTLCRCRAKCRKMGGCKTS